MTIYAPPQWSDPCYDGGGENNKLEHELIDIRQGRFLPVVADGFPIRPTATGPT
jgi:hypothetical protein